MKKIVICLVFICMMMGTLNVNAACGYGVNLSDGESVCLVEGATQANSTGTAYPENGTLVLKNYNGGSISYYSGLGNNLKPVTIKLIGDNYINSENNFGLRVPIGGIEFIGEGTLTIKSRLAIATIDFDKNNPNVQLNNNVNTIKIVAGDATNKSIEVEINDTDNSTNDETNENDGEFNWLVVLVLASCGISVICLIIVCITLFSKKNEKK